MGNTIPTQTRTIDPYSSYNSNVVNQLTRMISKGEDCIFGLPSLNITIDSIFPQTQLILSSGLCFKDDVIIEITNPFTIDMHDSDFYLSTNHFDEVGYYYIALKYTYLKSMPAPQAKITIFRPSEREFCGSGYLFLKAVYVVGVPGNLYIDSVYDYDPENSNIKRKYTQTYISVEDSLPAFDSVRDESRVIYVRSRDEIYFGCASTWLSWNSVRDMVNTVGCNVGSLVYLKSDFSTEYAISSSRETFAIGVVLQEGLSSTGSGKIRLFGRSDNVPVESGRTLTTGGRLFLSSIEAGKVTPAIPSYYEQFVGICISFDAVSQTCSMWFMPGNSNSTGGSTNTSISDGYTDLLAQSIFNKLTMDDFYNDDYINTIETTANIDFINHTINGENGEVFQTVGLSESGYSDLITSCQLSANTLNTNINWFVSNGASSGEFEQVILNYVHYFSTLRISVVNFVGSYVVGQIVTGETSLNTAIVCSENQLNGYVFVRNVVGSGVFQVGETLLSDTASSQVVGQSNRTDPTTYNNLYVRAEFTGDSIIYDYGIIYENDINIIGFDSSSFDSGVDTFADLDTTPSVVGHKIWKTNTSVVTITNFDDAYDGKELTIIFTNSNVTIQSNSNIKLENSLNFNGSTNDTIKLVYDRYNHIWFEQSRSLN
jgi:hypothetical protein